jgi:hypothetical protein
MVHVGHQQKLLAAGAADTRQRDMIRLPCFNHECAPNAARFRKRIPLAPPPPDSDTGGDKAHGFYLFE